MVKYGYLFENIVQAALAQLGERQTEDLKAPCSIHGGGNIFLKRFLFFHCAEGVLGMDRVVKERF